MANLFIEGFDHYPSGNPVSSQTGSPWTGQANPAYFTVSTTDAITGVNSLYSRAGFGVGFVARVIQPSVQEVYMGFGVIPLDFNPGLNIGVSGTSNAGVTITSSGRAAFRRDASVLSTSTDPVFIQGTKAYVEMRLTPTTYQVRVDGVQVLSGSMTSIGNMGFAGLFNVNATSSQTLRIDDIYVNDASGTVNNNYLGEVSVVTIFPDADETPQNWTKSVGSDGWAILDNVPATTDHIEAATASDESRFSFPALPFAVSNIHTVNPVFRGQKTTSGSSSVQPTLHNGAGSTAGTDQSQAENTYAYYHDVFELDPATGVAWNPASFAPQVSLTRTV